MEISTNLTVDVLSFSSEGDKINAKILESGKDGKQPEVGKVGNYNIGIDKNDVAHRFIIKDGKNKNIKGAEISDHTKVSAIKKRQKELNANKEEKDI